MAEGPQHTFDAGDGGVLSAFIPDCVERQIPGLGSTWVHGYCGRDVANWRYLARRMAKAHGDARVKGSEAQPTEECLAVARVITVCRRGPGSAAPSFQVVHGGEHQAFDTFQTAMPGLWVEEICREADVLTLQSYQKLDDPAREKAQAAERKLSELLDDPQFWAALDYLSLRLYGVRIAENGVPLGEVLTVMARDVQARDGMLNAVASLTGAVG